MRTLLSILFGLAILVTPVAVLAQTNLGGGDGGGEPGVLGGTPAPTGEGSALVNPLKADSLEQFLTEILAFIVRLGTIVLIVMIVVIGFMFVNARGKPEEIKKAKEALLWTLVGGVILIGASLIAEAIKVTVQAIGS